MRYAGRGGGIPWNRFSRVRGKNTLQGTDARLSAPGGQAGRRAYRDRDKAVAVPLFCHAEEPDDAKASSGSCRQRESGNGRGAGEGRFPFSGPSARCFAALPGGNLRKRVRYSRGFCLAGRQNPPSIRHPPLWIQAPIPAYATFSLPESMGSASAAGNRPDRWRTSRTGPARRPVRFSRRPGPL